ncbi:hypothetical protein BKA70DRAFT_338621 [Coprinopsis sp. MPI-PUGE-AT-0042]|nr:hypothetical protein BKA70DRAFT_338621 [Coprinopsis sp. MPI-PUGE-AT-0042]
MVDIAFTPALGEAIQVPISDCCDELDTVAVRFAAVLGYQEYRQVVDGHFKVQVWSDIASPDVQGWRAHDFELAVGSDGSSATAVPATSTSGTKVVRLTGGPSSSGGQSDQRPLRDSGKTQRLEASIPVSVRNARNFSFTYRIVYASGDIKWLGTYGHNGYAEVVRENLKGLNLSKGWSEAGRLFTLDGSEGSPVTIAAFENVEEYDVWAFPRGLSSLEPSSASDTEVLLAIPREFGVYTRNPSYVIHASPGAVMHLDTSASLGTLQAYGSGNIMVHACYDLSRLQSLLHLRPLESGGRVELKVLREEDQSAKCLVVSSSSSGRGKAPVKVVLIPVAQKEDEVEVQVNVETFFQGLGSTDRVALVAGNTTDVRFFQAPFEEQTCTFVVPKHGGEFILSPVHDFSAEKDSSLDACQISFLTPHSDVTQALEGPVSLPTPPPSPQIQTVKKPQVSFAKQAELIPSTPPTPHEPQQADTPARELRRRRQASSTPAIPPSTSDESTISTDSNAESPAKPSTEASSRPTNIFALLYYFAWIRYLVVLLRFVLSGGLGAWQQQKKETKAIAYVPEKRVLQDFSQEEEENVSESSSSDEEQQEQEQTEGVQEIHAPKPSLASQNTRSTKAIRVLYADLCLPSPSPFVLAPAKHETSLILSVQSQDSSLNKEATSMSSLHKVLTVNGEVPADLQVTSLTQAGSSVDYLVRFSLPLSADGGARLRIAEAL